MLNLFFYCVLDIGTILLSTLTLSFIIWNLVWYVALSTTYNPLTENIPKDKQGDYFFEEKGYSYYVKKPSYLRWTGNLTITNLESDNSIIIWPSLFKNRLEYGVLIHIGDTGDTSMGITIDEKLRPIESDPDSAKVINDNKREIELLMSEAKSFWNLK